MILSKIKSMAAVATCVLAAALTGCQAQTSMLSISERDDGLDD